MRACFAFPGCSSKHDLHGHHVQHWLDGGPTDADNLLNLCPRHHRAVHEGGYTIARAAPGRFVFREPAGRIVEHGEKNEVLT